MELTSIVLLCQGRESIQRPIRTNHVRLDDLVSGENAREPGLRGGQVNFPLDRFPEGG